MSVKVKLNLNIKELLNDIEPRLKAAGAATAGRLYQRGFELARQGFGRSGFNHWRNGYKFSKVDDGLYVIAVEGKFAMMMEDGIKTGEISRMIMHGTRAAYNRSQGKDYVDVPLFKDGGQSNSVRIGGEKFEINTFKNSDELMKHFSKPMLKQVTFTRGKSIEQEERIIQRSKKIEGLIRSQDPKSGNTAYLTIRRVTNESVWPETPYEGQKILDKLELEVEQIFSNMIEQFMRN
jgi:hypothetical protein